MQSYEPSSGFLSFHMTQAETALTAKHHLIKMGSKKLSEFVHETGTVEIPGRYGDDQLLGLARIVIGQQLSNQAARSIWNRLQIRFADRSKLIEALSDIQTQDTGLSTSKKRTLATIFDLGECWIDSLQKVPEKTRREAMLAVTGLGPWTVSMWELFVLKSPDQWADNDLILNRISTEFAADAKLERHKLIENTAPFRSYFALYCWRFNDSKK